MARWNNVTARDLQRVANKLSLENTGHHSRETRYWYILDGQKVLKVTFPNVHGGGQTVSPGFVKNIMSNLKINKEQWIGLVDCPMSADDYAVHMRELREQGII